MPLFIDMNSEKYNVVLFGNNPLKVSELFDINAEKKYVVLFVVTLLMCQNCCYEYGKKVCSIIW